MPSIPTLPLAVPAAGDDHHICIEIVSDLDYEPELGVGLRREQATNARWVASNPSRQSGLARPIGLAQFVKRADDRVDLFDLAAGTLILAAELRIPHTFGLAALMKALMTHRRS
ncbi:MAG TPA: hypothetical protein VGL37_00725 [Solirubrobacteraceae bacterium]|jgi:hypothetical protein